jgi:hypothetical protein
MNTSYARKTSFLLSMCVYTNVYKEKLDCNRVPVLSSSPPQLFYLLILIMKSDKISPYKRGLYKLVLFT